MNKWATLKQDMYGFASGPIERDVNGFASIPAAVLIPQGTIVDIGGFTSLAICGDVTIVYNPDERDELFEELK